MGRITGSASIETLVRVGIEKENGLSPESKMVVIHDFTPCVDDELEVKRGQVVHKYFLPIANKIQSNVNISGCPYTVPRERLGLRY